MSKVLFYDMKMDTWDFTLQNPWAVAGGQAGGQPVWWDTNQQQTQPVTEAIDFDLWFDNFTEETKYHTFQ